MSSDAHGALLDEIVRCTTGLIASVATHPQQADEAAAGFERLSEMQELFCREFPVPSDPVEFWETLWRSTDRMRDQWLRIERLAVRAGRELRSRLQRALDEKRRDLYRWTRRFICDRAPQAPLRGHFEFGISNDRPHLQTHHERIEGLYESIKRMGRFPDIREGLSLPRQCCNFAIIYGGGWNVSSYSLLRGAAHLEPLNAFVAFDYPDPGLFATAGTRTVRLAPAGLVRLGDDSFALATFDEPAVVHFACPHAWTGTPVEETGLPILRSQLTLEIVDEKVTTSEALRWYADRTGAQLPLIRERFVPRASLPADPDELGRCAERAVSALERSGVGSVVVKPSRGEQEQGVGRFDLATSRSAAVEHAVRLAYETTAVIQERIATPGSDDFNWRVLVALDPGGSPAAVGRFARTGHGDQVEMVRDDEMLSRIGITGRQARQFVSRLDSVAVEAFRAVAGFAAHRHHDYRWKPLGGGSYAVPYFLGVDLIGEAYVMEVNGNEVAGMWTHDRLYPHLRGQTTRTFLESALKAGEGYRRLIQAP